MNDNLDNDKVMFDYVGRIFTMREHAILNNDPNLDAPSKFTLIAITNFLCMNGNKIGICEFSLEDLCNITRYAKSTIKKAIENLTKNDYFEFFRAQNIEDKEIEKEKNIQYDKDNIPKNERKYPFFAYFNTNDEETKEKYSGYQKYIKLTSFRNYMFYKENIFYYVSMTFDKYLMNLNEKLIFREDMNELYNENKIINKKDKPKLTLVK